jgi:CAAX prenyl protease-like protein
MGGDRRSKQLTPLFARREAAALPRILPFALFMACIALESGLRWVSGLASAAASEHPPLFLWLYPVRTAMVLGALIFFWPAYQELRGKVWADWKEALLTFGVGVLVYLVWVRLAWPWAMQGQAAGYNPWQVGGGTGVILAGLRLFGAVIVVPVMEELFWRSFLLRYLVASPFTSVRLGTFTPLSFGATVILFGLEHHLWLAGMLAGVAYALVLYTTHRLWPCILAHAITNLFLGIHVLLTGEWQWW